MDNNVEGKWMPMDEHLRKAEGTSPINMGICTDMPIWEASRETFPQPPLSTAMMPAGEWADLGVQQRVQSVDGYKGDSRSLSNFAGAIKSYYTYTYLIICSHGILCTFVITVFDIICVCVSSPTLVSTVCMRAWSASVRCWAGDSASLWQQCHIGRQWMPCSCNPPDTGATDAMMSDLRTENQVIKGMTDTPRIHAIWSWAPNISEASRIPKRTYQEPLSKLVYD